MTDCDAIYDAIISNIKFKHKHASFKEKFKNASVIKLPYLNENHSKEIKQILLKSNLNILPIFTPGQKLVDVLCKTALENKQCKSKNCTYKDNNCITKDVIYELSCSECEDKYIGETKRSLHTRINEHHKSIFYNRGNPAMLEHYKQHHNNSINSNPFKVKILEKSHNTTDRKIKEALWIEKKSPKINRDIGWKIKKYRKY